MGYEPNNEYIIENDVEDINKPVAEKRMKRGDLPEGYEYEEVSKPKQDDGILKSAKQEGFYQEGYVGGEGAKPEDVINALRNSEDSEGTKKVKEEYEEKRVEELITITATRDLLMSQAKQIIPIYIKTSAMIKDPKTGKEKLTPVKAEFKIKRLTESENTHLLNHKLIGKDIPDMTTEEYIESSHFRSKFLEASVVEPHFSAEEWRTEVPNGIVTSLYEEVNKIQTSADDSALFQ